MGEGAWDGAAVRDTRARHAGDDIVVLPSGTVTILFTDIEGSTKGWEHDEATMAAIVARHDELLRDTIESAGGCVFKTVGDGVHAVFTDAAEAVVGAAAVQRAVDGEPWPLGMAVRVRCALHTGVCELRDADYFGPTMNRVARLESAAHGGQTVMSDATHALVVDRLPAGLACTDLGVHALKDLARPERVWQLDVIGGARRFPALMASRDPVRRTNLPAETSSFVGRTDELDHLGMLLVTSRLLTIVGTGGVGKTRVALRAVADHAARNADDWPDGVWLVDLAARRDPEQVAPAMLHAIGVREDPTREPMVHLVEACADRRMLVVLDSCEHVVDAVAVLADQLLRGAAGVALAVTSREPLRIEGEQRYQLEPLVGTAAVELFVQRARLQQPRFDLTPDNADAVRRICRALDGLPLAIELAAARLDVMSIETLAARVDQPLSMLDDGTRGSSVRRRTMEAVLDWSWDLLTDGEQAVLARLSVAPGSFTLEAASRFTSAGDIATADEAATLIMSLVRKSLVRITDDGRYAMLAIIRSYATHRLADAGVDAVRCARVAHRAVQLDLARAAVVHMPGPEQSVWVQRIEREHHNVIAAIDRSCDDNDVARGLELATALDDYWSSSGLFSYAVGALDRLVDAGRDVVAPALVCRALADIASHEMRRGAYDDANRHCREAVALARTLGAGELLVRALTSCALTEVGAIDEALAFHTEALDVARRLGDDRLIARALQSRQFSLAAHGRFDESVRTLVEERIVRARLDDGVGEALALSNLTDEHLQRGDADAAGDAVGAALAILARHPSAAVEAPARLNAGWVELSRGDRSGAAIEFRRALDVARRAGLLSDVDYAILGIAHTACHADDAGVLHGAADALLEARGEQLQPLEATRRAADHERVRAELGAAFAAHYRRGRALTRPDAVALACTVDTRP